MALRDLLGRAVAGDPAVAVVLGEAGVGKTRLVSTVLEGFGTSQQIRGYCAPPIAGETPFAPLVGAILEALRAQPPQRTHDLLAAGDGILASVLPGIVPSAGSMPAAGGGIGPA
jgi:predicted ATPase